MKRFVSLLALTTLALPLAAVAQTTAPIGVTPPDQPTSQIEKDATTKTGQSIKYGTQGTDLKTTTSTAGKSQRSFKTTNGDAKKSGATEPGDVPTYPAPAKDGTPTK